MEHEDKAQSSLDAEPNSITPRHRALMRRLVAGQNQGEAARDIGMSDSRASIIVNSPLFKAEMDKMREGLDGMVMEAEADKVSSDPTKIILSETSEMAAKTMKGALSDASPSVRISAAKDILDRTGYGKEDKIKANVFVEPSQSLIDVIGRISVERKASRGEGEDE